MPRSLARPPATPLALALAAVASLVCYLWVYRSAAGRALGPLANLMATVAGSLVLTLLAHHAAQRALPARRGLLLLFLGLAAFRLAPPPSAIIASDDAYRYLWDGRVQAAGINPFRYAPVAPELASLVDREVHPRIFRPDMRTVYPPLAQAWFLLVALLGGSFAALKGVMLVHELATVWLLVLWLRRRGLPEGRALLYAWSPLAVVQGFAGVHLDLLLLPWLLAALLWAEERPVWSGVALAMSALVRPLTLLGAPALALRRPFRETLRFGLGFTIASVALTLPYANVGWQALTESLRSYGQNWQFNGSLFQLADALLNQWALFRPALYALISLLALGAAFLPTERRLRLAAALAAYLIWAPTVYPWYLLSLLLLLAPGGGPLPLALPALITLSDLVFVRGVVGGRWQVPRGALWLEYLGIYGLALYQFAWRRRRSLRTRSAVPTEARPTS